MNPPTPGSMITILAGFMQVCNAPTGTVRLYDDMDWSLPSYPSPATILDPIRCAADAVQSEYGEILKRVRNAPLLYVDETPIKVREKKHRIRESTTSAETFVVIRKRDLLGRTEVSTRLFNGMIV